MYFCMRLPCMHVCLYVRLSVFTITQEGLDVEWWNLTHTYTLKVMNNVELEDGSRTWPLTRSNWWFSWCEFRVHVRLHSVHVHCTDSFGILVCMCYIQFIKFFFQSVVRIYVGSILIWSNVLPHNLSVCACACVCESLFCLDSNIMNGVEEVERKNPCPFLFLS